jgi:hypothetical protein
VFKFTISTIDESFSVDMQHNTKEEEKEEETGVVRTISIAPPFNQPIQGFTSKEPRSS